jgi:hypothetical protein
MQNQVLYINMKAVIQHINHATKQKNKKTKTKTQTFSFAAALTDAGRPTLLVPHPPPPARLSASCRAPS